MPWNPFSTTLETLPEFDEQKSGPGKTDLGGLTPTEQVTLARQQSGPGKTDLGGQTPTEMRADFSVQQPGPGKTDLGGLTPTEQQPQSTYEVFKESARRGLEEGFTSAKQGLTDPFADLKPKAPERDYTGRLLQQPITEGWSDPNWWVAHITRGTTASAPSLATGIAGGAAGTAMGGPLGGAAGTAAGFGFGSIMQSLAPAYQNARAKGLDHEAAVDEAMKVSEIAGWWGAAMGAAPGVSLFGRTAEGTLRRPISEALAQIFGVQPALVAGRMTDESLTTTGELPEAEAVATGMAEAAGVGAALTGGSAAARASGTAARNLYNRAREPRVEVLPPEAKPEEPINFIDLIPDAEGVYGGNAAPQRAMGTTRGLLEAPRGDMPQGGTEGAPPPPSTPPRQPSGGQDTFAARQEFASRIKGAQEPGPVRAEPVTRTDFAAEGPKTGKVLAFQKPGEAPKAKTDQYGIATNIRFQPKDAQRVAQDHPLVAEKIPESFDSLNQITVDGKPYGYMATFRGKDAAGNEYQSAQGWDLNGNPLKIQKSEFPDGQTDYAIETGPLQGFYSPAQKAVVNAKHKKAPASQWIGQLNKGPAGNEAKQLGLDLWLQEKGKGESVTAEEIQDWLKAHEVEVIEKTRSEPNLAMGNYRVSPKVPGYREVTIIPKGLDYSSGHFKENEVLAVTSVPRTGPNGENYLALEQVQSDLHQKARKEGYRTAAIDKNLNEVKQKIDNIIEESNIEDVLINKISNSLDGYKIVGKEREGWDLYKDNNFIANVATSNKDLATKHLVKSAMQYRLEDIPEIAERYPEISKLKERYSNLKRQSKYGQPDAPFKGDLWWQLGVKWAIGDAMRNSQEGVILPTPRQMAQASGGNAQKLSTLYGTKIPSWTKKYVKGLGGEVVKEAIPDFVSENAPYSNQEDVNLITESGDRVEDINTLIDALMTYGINYSRSSAWKSKGLMALQLAEMYETIRNGYAEGKIPESTFNHALQTGLNQLYHGKFAGHSFRDELTKGFYKDTKGNKHPPVLEAPGYWVVKFTPEMRENLQQSGQSLFADGGGKPQQLSKQPGYIGKLKNALKPPIQIPNELIGEELRSQVRETVRGGQSVSVDPSVAQYYFNLASATGRLIPSDIPVNVLQRIDYHNADSVKATYQDRDGNEVELFAPINELLRIRAFHSSDGFGNSALFFSPLNSAGQVDERILGELWHEATHALRRNGYFPDAIWSRLARHARLLNILDMDFRDFAQASKYPRWQEFEPGVSVREIYEELYKDEPDLDERLIEEGVTHMLELAQHGFIDSVQIAPIQDILHDMEYGRYLPGFNDSSGTQYSVSGPTVSGPLKLGVNFEELPIPEYHGDFIKAYPQFRFVDIESFQTAENMYVVNKVYDSGSGQLKAKTLGHVIVSSGEPLFLPTRKPEEWKLADDVEGLMSLGFDSDLANAIHNEYLYTVLKEPKDVVLNKAGPKGPVGYFKTAANETNIGPKILQNVIDNVEIHLEGNDIHSVTPIDALYALNKYLLKNDDVPHFYYDVYNTIKYDLMTNKFSIQKLNLDSYEEYAGYHPVFRKLNKDTFDNYVKNVEEISREQTLIGFLLTTDLPGLDTTKHVFLDPIEQNGIKNTSYPFTAENLIKWGWSAQDAKNVVLKFTNNGLPNNMQPATQEEGEVVSVKTIDYESIQDLKNQSAAFDLLSETDFSQLLSVTGILVDNEYIGYAVKFPQATIFMKSNVVGGQPTIFDEAAFDSAYPNLSKETVKEIVSKVDSESVPEISNHAQVMAVIEDAVYEKKYSTETMNKILNILYDESVTEKYLGLGNNADMTLVQAAYVLNIAKNESSEKNVVDQVNYIAKKLLEEAFLAFPKYHEVAEYIDGKSISNNIYDIIGSPFSLNLYAGAQFKNGDILGALTKILKNNFNYTNQQVADYDYVMSILTEGKKSAPKAKEESEKSSEELYIPEGFNPPVFDTIEKARKSLGPLALELFDTLNNHTWLKKYAPDVSNPSEKLSKTIEKYINKNGNHISPGIIKQLQKAAYGLIPQPQNERELANNKAALEAGLNLSTKIDHTPESNIATPSYKNLKEAAYTLSSTGKVHLADALTAQVNPLGVKIDNPTDLSNYDNYDSSWNAEIANGIEAYLIKGDGQYVPAAILEDLQRIATGLRRSQALTFSQLLKEQRKDPLNRVYTFSGQASGGTKPKEVWRDQDGKEYMFKPVKKGEEFLAYSEALGGQISSLVNPKGPEIFTIELNGRLGSMQEYLPNEGTLREKGIDVNDLTVAQVRDIQREHVVDWLISNHDAHNNQFLVQEDGSIIGIDKGQAFKYFGKDKLDIDYHPNAKYGEKEPIYNTIWRAYKNGGLTKFRDEISKDEKQDVNELKNQAELLNQEIKELNNKYDEIRTKIDKVIDDYNTQIRGIMYGDNGLADISETLRENIGPLLLELKDALKSKEIKNNQYYVPSIAAEIHGDETKVDRPVTLIKENEWGNEHKKLYGFYWSFGKNRLLEPELKNAANEEDVINVIYDVYDSDVLGESENVPPTIAFLTWDQDPAIRHENFSIEHSQITQIANILLSKGFDHVRLDHPVTGEPITILLPGNYKTGYIYDKEKVDDLNNQLNEKIKSISDNMLKSTVSKFTKIFNKKEMKDVMWNAFDTYNLSIESNFLTKLQFVTHDAIAYGTVFNDESILSESANSIFSMIESHANNTALANLFELEDPLNGVNKETYREIQKKAEKRKDVLEGIKKQLSDANKRLDQALYREVIDTIQKIQLALDDKTYMDMLRPYAESRFKGREVPVQAFLDYAVQRKNRLGNKFFSFFVSIDNLHQRAKQAMVDIYHSSVSEYDREWVESKRKENPDLYGKISAIEYKAIRDYTGSAYSSINSQLRKDKVIVSDELNSSWVRAAEYAAIISSGLEKLPPYKGKSYRREGKDNAVQIAEFKIGSIYSNNQFMSTTTNYIESGYADIVFYIESKTGRDVSHMSNYPNEKEVLFAPGKQFLITNVVKFQSDSGYDRWSVFMTELPEVDFNDLE